MIANIPPPDRQHFGLSERYRSGQKQGVHTDIKQIDLLARQVKPCRPRTCQCLHFLRLYSMIKKQAGPMTNPQSLYPLLLSRHSCYAENKSRKHT